MVYPLHRSTRAARGGALDADRTGRDMDMTAFQDALACDDDARALFHWLAPGHRAAFEAWILEVGDPAGRLARVSQAVEILAGREPTVN
jgi:uncharacterized protein YdeI (YjbR/CyaY-like superfamily)